LLCKLVEFHLERLDGLRATLFQLVLRGSVVPDYSIDTHASRSDNEPTMPLEDTAWGQQLLWLLSREARDIHPFAVRNIICMSLNSRCSQF
jgi:hypothetical protein